MPAIVAEQIERSLVGADALDRYRDVESGSVIAPSGKTLTSLRAAVDKVRERGSEVIAISDDETFLAAGTTAFPLVRTVPEWLTPLLTVIPGQVAAVRLARLHGADVDSPTGLTKITLTR